MAAGAYPPARRTNIPLPQGDFSNQKNPAGFSIAYTNATASLHRNIHWIRQTLQTFLLPMNADTISAGQCYDQNPQEKENEGPGRRTGQEIQYR